MKKLALLFSLASLPFLGSAQDVPVNSETNKVTYTEVVTAEGLTQADIYLKAQEWFAKTFKDANSVIQVQDKDKGVIIGKGFNDIHIGSVPKKLWYTIKIEGKENRYRYEISDILMQDYPTQYNNYSSDQAPIEPIIITYLNDKKGKPRKLNVAIKAETVKAMNDLTGSIKKGITQTPKTDW